MNGILEFYKGTGVEGNGWRLDEVLDWSDAQLEAVHDYIQWLFPLPEKSLAVPWSPVLDAKTVAAFGRDEKMRVRLRAAFERMLAFYGFAWRDEAGEQGCVVESGDFASRAANWLTPGNHNHLRLTRMVRSLRILGLDAEADALWQALQAVYATDAGRAAISEKTYRFWTRAATEAPKVMAVEK